MVAGMRLTPIRFFLNGKALYPLKIMPCLKSPTLTLFLTHIRVCSLWRVQRSFRCRKWLISVVWLPSCLMPAPPRAKVWTWKREWDGKVCFWSSINPTGRSLGWGRYLRVDEREDCSSTDTVRNKEIVIYTYIERKFRISDQPKPVPLFYIAVYGDQVKMRARILGPRSTLLVRNKHRPWIWRPDEQLAS
jgi:hypothetical protein